MVVIDMPMMQVKRKVRVVLPPPAPARFWLVLLVVLVLLIALVGEASLSAFFSHMVAIETVTSTVLLVWYYVVLSSRRVKYCCCHRTIRVLRSTVLYCTVIAYLLYLQYHCARIHEGFGFLPRCRHCFLLHENTSTSTSTSTYTCTIPSDEKSSSTVPVPDYK